MKHNWEKPRLPTFRGDQHPHSSINSRLLVCESEICRSRWLTLNFRRFDWISAASRKVLTLLESTLRYFEVLKFLWQQRTTSQDQSSKKHTGWSARSALQVHFKCTWKVQCETTLYAIGDKMSWDTLPKTGLFYVLLTSKGGNIAFLPHPLRAMLCPCSSYL